MDPPKQAGILRLNPAAAPFTFTPPASAPSVVGVSDSPVVSEPPRSNTRNKNKSKNKNKKKADVQPPVKKRGQRDNFPRETGKIVPPPQPVVALSPAPVAESKPPVKSVVIMLNGIFFFLCVSFLFLNFFFQRKRSLARGLPKDLLRVPLPI
jgi:hypothetical protein